MKKICAAGTQNKKEPAMPITLQMPEDIQKLADTFNVYGVRTSITCTESGSSIARLDQPAFFKSINTLGNAGEVEAGEPFVLHGIGATPELAIKAMIRAFKSKATGDNCLVIRKGGPQYNQDNYFSYAAVQSSKKAPGFVEIGAIKALKKPNTLGQDFRPGIFLEYKPGL
jgi:hypothetical protein